VGVAGLRCFIHLANIWGLNAIESSQILGLDSCEYEEVQNKIKANCSIAFFSDDLIQRLSLVIGIQKQIELLFPKHRWIDYMQTPNRQFENLSPLTLISSGELSGIKRVHSYLMNAGGSHYL